MSKIPEAEIDAIALEHEQRAADADCEAAYPGHEWIADQQRTARALRQQWEEIKALREAVRDFAGPHAYGALLRHAAVIARAREAEHG